MASALLVAQVPCIVSTLWRVENLSASLFFSQFYRNLQSKQSATAAAPGRWQFATAAATGTADITTTVAATSLPPFDWDVSEYAASAQNRR